MKARREQLKAGHFTLSALMSEDRRFYLPTQFINDLYEFGEGFGACEMGYVIGYFVDEEKLEIDEEVIEAIPLQTFNDITTQLTEVGNSKAAYLSKQLFMQLVKKSVN